VLGGPGGKAWQALRQGLDELRRNPPVFGQVAERVGQFLLDLGVVLGHQGFEEGPCDGANVPARPGGRGERVTEVGSSMRTGDPISAIQLFQKGVQSNRHTWILPRARSSRPTAPRQYHRRL
jgi:hypothetical protein